MVLPAATLMALSLCRPIQGPGNPGFLPSWSLLQDAAVSAQPVDGCGAGEEVEGCHEVLSTAPCRNPVPLCLLSKREKNSDFSFADGADLGVHRDITGHQIFSSRVLCSETVTSAFKCRIPSWHILQVQVEYCSPEIWTALMCSRL